MLHKSLSLVACLASLSMPRTLRLTSHNRDCAPGVISYAIETRRISLSTLLSTLLYSTSTIYLL